MNAKLILLGAIVTGALGGYAWSALSSAAPARAEATPVAASTIASVEPVSATSAEDRAWSGRGTVASSGPTSAQRHTVEQGVQYAGCNEVRALGKAPLYAGQPGYRIEMDGDGDGVACEPYRGAP